MTFRRVLDFIPRSSSANYRFRELQDFCFTASARLSALISLQISHVLRCQNELPGEMGQRACRRREWKTTKYFFFRVAFAAVRLSWRLMNLSAIVLHFFLAALDLFVHIFAHF
jgi:hypothetical protein